MGKLQIKTGERYNKLKIIEEVSGYKQPSGQVKRQFKCICDCGNKVIVRLSHLRSSITKSCGCWKLSVTSDRGKKNKTHGLSKSRTYKSWRMLKERCNNPKTKGYEYYGGRGIRVCDRWLNSFENFYNDMGIRPLGKTIDRINVNGNYEPSNCRWATPSEQTLNQRK